MSGAVSNLKEVLEQAEQLLVQRVVAFGVTLAKVTEAVRVVAIKAKQCGDVLTFKVDDAAAHEVLGERDARLERGRNAN